MPTKLEQLQLQFRQKLMQEKEERMIKIHTDNQMKALTKVTKYSSKPPTPPQNAPRKPPALISAKPPNHQQSPVKKGSPGVDRSRPLPPINRDSKSHSKSTNHIHRSPQSSSSSDKSSIAHDVGRSRSVDLESADSLPGAKVNGRAAKLGLDLYCVTSSVRPSSYQQQVPNGKRSPTPDSYSQRHHTELQRWKSNGKQTLENSQKIANGEASAFTAKSSSLVNNRSQPSNYTTKPSTRPSPPLIVARKPVISRQRNGVSQMCAPKSKPPNPGQETCRYCRRNFNEDRIAKHIAICSKTSTKKVKVFDATKMRVKGTEAESFVKRGASVRQPPQVNKTKQQKKSNWKKQHEDFINAIRQAKMAQKHLAAGGKLSDLPPPPPSDTSDYVPCPYCGRKFNEGVAQRHIPKCKNIVSNKKTTSKKK